MKQTFTIPIGCLVISMEQVGNRIITTFEPEFKKGDVIYCEDNDGFNWVFILKEKINGEVNYYTYFYIFTSAGMIVSNGGCRYPERTFRHATPEEAQRLWDALAEEGKRWNPETMQAEEIKKDRWRAKTGEIYYCLFADMSIVAATERGDTVDNPRYNSGNYFQSKEQAEMAKLYVQKAYNDFWKKELQ